MTLRRRVSACLHRQTARSRSRNVRCRPAADPRGMPAMKAGLHHLFAGRVRVPAIVALLLFVAAAGQAGAQSRNLAPGFTALPRNATIAIIPTDIELFSLSAGGVPEPRADWTAAANKYFKSALVEKKRSLGATAVDVSERDADDLAEVTALHAAIARSIAIHHFGPSFTNQPT